ncbi:MAG: polysaccharide biosynthesis protein [Marinobacter sp. T13-3]|nr:MAG: polysaccharide biosynthesis protein [Marinobacter sp. T13-3]
MRIAFRTDASIWIGTGHVMRCLTLADELRRQGHECVFVCREHEGHLGDLIGKKGFKLHLLSKTDSQQKPSMNEPHLAHAGWLGASWQKDGKETSDLLHNQRPDWLVVDHYALDARWEREVAHEVGQIMVIDDLADREHECTVLLDQNLGRQPGDYELLVPSYCSKLIGPQYALLRPEFSQIRPESLARRQSPKLERILISLGGVDRTNVTGQVLEALAKSELPSDVELDIVMGAAAPRLEDIRRQAAELRFPATVSVSVSDMAERMCKADLAIGAAGGTAWERCCLGLPSIILVLADNQRAGAGALAHSASALVIKETEIASDLINKIKNVQESGTLAVMAESASVQTAGKGALEVCHIIETSSRGNRDD